METPTTCTPIFYSMGFSTHHNFCYDFFIVINFYESMSMIFCLSIDEFSSQYNVVWLP